LLSGTLVADETWIGGDPKNQHTDAKRALGAKKWTTRKTIVLSVVDKPTGELRSTVVPNVKAATLRKALEDDLMVNLGASVLHTDSAKAYLGVALASKGHETVNHDLGEYERDGVSTNLAEGAFSQMKRSIDGTHHRVSVEHLPRYLAQFDWLYTNCKATDSDRMRLLAEGMTGRRLTYRPLTGKSES
jgi:transposase-like protein